MKSPENLRNKVVTMKLTAAEYEKIKKMADDEAMPISVYLRTQMLGKSNNKRNTNTADKKA